MNIATHERRRAAWARTRGRMKSERGTETKHRNRGGGSTILENRIYPENLTIGTAVGSAFVRRGTIDENTPQNSWTRQRVDFDAHRHNWKIGVRKRKRKLEWFDKHCPLISLDHVSFSRPIAEYPFRSTILIHVNCCFIYLPALWLSPVNHSRYVIASGVNIWL